MYFGQLICKSLLKIFIQRLKLKVNIPPSFSACRGQAAMKISLAHYCRPVAPKMVLLWASRVFNWFLANFASKCCDNFNENCLPNFSSKIFFFNKEIILNSLKIQMEETCEYYLSSRNIWLIREQFNYKFSTSSSGWSERWWDGETTPTLVHLNYVHDQCGGS